MSSKPDPTPLPDVGSSVSVWFQRKVRVGVVHAAVMANIAIPASARVTVRFAIAKGEELTRTLPWKHAPAIIEAHTAAFAYPLAAGRDTVRA